MHCLHWLYLQCRVCTLLRLIFFENLIIGYRVVVNLTVASSCLERLRKTFKSPVSTAAVLIQPEPLEYEAGLPTTEPQILIYRINIWKPKDTTDADFSKFLGGAQVCVASSLDTRPQRTQKAAADGKSATRTQGTKRNSNYSVFTYLRSS
jgi:hypothetical protein